MQELNSYEFAMILRWMMAACFVFYPGQLSADAILKHKFIWDDVTPIDIFNIRALMDEIHDEKNENVNLLDFQMLKHHQRMIARGSEHKVKNRSSLADVTVLDIERNPWTVLSEAAEMGDGSEFVQINYVNEEPAATLVENRKKRCHNNNGRLMMRKHGGPYYLHSTYRIAETDKGDKDGKHKNASSKGNRNSENKLESKKPKMRTVYGLRKGGFQQEAYHDDGDDATAVRTARLSHNSEIPSAKMSVGQNYVVQFKGSKTKTTPLFEFSEVEDNPLNTTSTVPPQASFKLREMSGKPPSYSTGATDKTICEDDSTTRFEDFTYGRKMEEESQITLNKDSSTRKYKQSSTKALEHMIGVGHSQDSFQVVGEFSTDPLAEKLHDEPGFVDESHKEGVSYGAEAFESDTDVERLIDEVRENSPLRGEYLASVTERKVKSEVNDGRPSQKTSEEEAIKEISVMVGKSEITTERLPRMKTTARLRSTLNPSPSRKFRLNEKAAGDSIPISTFKGILKNILTNFIPVKCDEEREEGGIQGNSTILGNALTLNKRGENDGGGAEDWGKSRKTYKVNNKGHPQPLGILKQLEKVMEGMHPSYENVSFADGEPWYKDMKESNSTTGDENSKMNKEVDDKIVNDKVSHEGDRNLVIKTNEEEYSKKIRPIFEFKRSDDKFEEEGTTKSSTFSWGEYNTDSGRNSDSRPNPANETTTWTTSFWLENGPDIDLNLAKAVHRLDAISANISGILNYHAINQTELAILTRSMDEALRKLNYSSTSAHFVNSSVSDINDKINGMELMLKEITAGCCRTCPRGCSFNCGGAGKCPERVEPRIDLTLHTDANAPHLPELWPLRQAIIRPQEPSHLFHQLPQNTNGYSRSNDALRKYYTQPQPVFVNSSGIKAAPLPPTVIVQQAATRQPFWKNTQPQPVFVNNSGIKAAPLPPMVIVQQAATRQPFWKNNDARVSIPRPMQFLTQPTRRSEQFLMKPLKMAQILRPVTADPKNLQWQPRPYNPSRSGGRLAFHSATGNKCPYRDTSCEDPCRKSDDDKAIRSLFNLDGFLNLINLAKTQIKRDPDGLVVEGRRPSRMVASASDAYPSPFKFVNPDIVDEFLRVTSKGKGMIMENKSRPSTSSADILTYTADQAVKFLNILPNFDTKITKTSQKKEDDFNYK